MSEMVKTSELSNSIGASHHNDLAQHTEYQSDQ